MRSRKWLLFWNTGNIVENHFSITVDETTDILLCWWPTNQPWWVDSTTAQTITWNNRRHCIEAFLTATELSWYCYGQALNLAVQESITFFMTLWILWKGWLSLKKSPNIKFCYKWWWMIACVSLRIHLLAHTYLNCSFSCSNIYLRKLCSSTGYGVTTEQRQWNART